MSENTTFASVRDDTQSSIIAPTTPNIAAAIHRISTSGSWLALVRSSNSTTKYTVRHAISSDVLPAAPTNRQKPNGDACTLPYGLARYAW